MENDQPAVGAMKKYPFIVNGDLVEKWRRLYPRGVRMPFLILPENQRVRIHVDLCLHTMNLTEVAASVRERFGALSGLSVCSIHTYYKNFWSVEFPSRKRRGSARHRRGKVRVLEQDPYLLPAVSKLVRFSRATLIWILLTREVEPQTVPSCKQVQLYVRRVTDGKTAGASRQTAIEQDPALVKRIGELMRCGRPRLIHEILVRDFGAVAPVKPDTVAEYLRAR